jgi:hypothetical protein
MVPERGTPNPTDTWTEDNLLRQVLYKGQREDGPEPNQRLSRGPRRTPSVRVSIQFSFLTTTARQNPP